MPPPLKRSGLQNEVVNFYRQCFRAAREKPAVRKQDPDFMHSFVKSSKNTTFEKLTLQQLNTCSEKEESNLRRTLKKV
ncbi:hypothetical protein PS6_005163 [Mucor atramentarius]